MAFNEVERAAILAHLAAGGSGLDPFVRKAVEQLKDVQSKAR